MTNVNNLVMSSVSLFEGKQSMAGGGGTEPHKRGPGFLRNLGQEFFMETGRDWLGGWRFP